MDFTLTSAQENTFNFEGTTYTVDEAYETTLMVFELLEDDTFLDFEKVNIALELFLDMEFDNEDWEYNFRLFKHIFKFYLDTDLDEEKESGNKKEFDFKKDAELIYASFLSAYNIDLIDMRGKLEWHKFIKLLRQLDKDSPFKTAVGYRVMKIPKETKYNKEQIKEIKRLKKLYELEKESESKEAQDNKLESAFKALAGGDRKR